jgi:uncharacterized membrane protein
MTIYRYICWLFLYSVIGWIYESVLCSITEKRWVNRGFLNGPYCPVYGFGAILDLMILDEIRGVFILFYLGAVLTCTWEYITSWLMEKLFHARWWDYSEHKYNLNGRVCLAGAVVFGTFTVILMRVVHPEIAHLTALVSDSTIFALTWIIVIIFIVDCNITVVNVLDFNKKLKLTDVRLQLAEIKNQLLEVTMLIKKLNLQERRLLRAFPRLKSILYNDALQLIKEAFQNAIWKKYGK